MQKVFFIIPDAENPFFVTLATLLQRSLTLTNRSLVVLSSDNTVTVEIENIRLVENEAKDESVVGLVFISTGANVASYELIESIIPEVRDGSGIPVIIVDRPVVHPEKYTCNIICDNQRGAEIAARHLFDMGHRRIGILTGREDTDPAAVRFEFFMRTLEELGVGRNTCEIFPGDFTFTSGKTAAARFAAMASDKRPTAVFCANDLSAAGFIQGASEHGIAVPSDVSVIGFDGSPISRWTTPSLSTVSQPLEEIANHIEYALFFEHNNEINLGLSKVVWVEPSLIERNSVRIIK